MQYQVAVKLKKMKTAIKEWREQNGISPKSKIVEIKRQLEDIYEQQSANAMNFEVHKKELEPQSQLSFWLSKEEDKAWQKSRELWLKLGDRNPKFFYSASKIRNHKNQINHMINADGLQVTNGEELRESNLLFYKQLFNTDTHCVTFSRAHSKEKSDPRSSWMAH